MTEIFKESVWIDIPRFCENDRMLLRCFPPTDCPPWLHPKSKAHHSTGAEARALKGETKDSIKGHLKALPGKRT